MYILSFRRQNHHQGRREIIFLLKIIFFGQNDKLALNAILERIKPTNSFKKTSFNVQLQIKR
jgi:hypothetical protein